MHRVFVEWVDEIELTKHPSKCALIYFDRKKVEWVDGIELTKHSSKCALIHFDEKRDTYIVNIVFTVYRLENIMFRSLTAVFTVIRKDAETSSNRQNPEYTYAELSLYHHGLANGTNKLKKYSRCPHCSNHREEVWSTIFGGPVTRVPHAWTNVALGAS